MELKGKRVLVTGSGISGTAAANLLFHAGAEVILYDSNEQIEVSKIRAKLDPDVQAEIVLGKAPDIWKEVVDLVVMSPGVPTDLPFVQELRCAGIPIWGEIELAWQMSRGMVMAITGTNGKTTTTALLGHIMRLSKRDGEVFVVGNIGIPYTSIASQTTAQSVVVAEVSSFQLETVHSFRPAISAVLNISPDHLNRHHTMERYIAAKQEIMKCQEQSDICVLNYEDAVTRAMAEQTAARVFWFSSARTLKQGIYIDNGTIVYNNGEDITSICRTDELNIPGTHNHENAMAAAAMSISAGVPLETIREGLRTFTAVEHRIEYVTERNGVVYYNDSKGTNPDAAIKGIQAMDRPTLLIGGGYDKNSDYTEWIRAFDGRVRYLVLVGETREKIAATARREGFESIIMADTFEEAVRICSERAVAGDAVLLSPACASWGMFDNYEQRGRRFKELVLNMK